MPVQLLSEIRLINATKGDIARAINFSMKKSKKAAWNMTRALNLRGSVKPFHLEKIYDADVFTTSGTLTKQAASTLANDTKKTLKLFGIKNSEVSLMDYANAFAKQVSK